MAENFKAAFASARKAGKKVFDWNGKSYNTKLAPDATPSPKARPAPMGPKARPAAGKGSAATATSPAVPPFPKAKAVTKSGPSPADIKGTAATRTSPAVPPFPGGPKSAPMIKAGAAARSSVGKVGNKPSNRYSGERKADTGVASKLAAIRAGNDKSRKEREAARKARREARGS